MVEKVTQDETNEVYCMYCLSPAHACLTSTPNVHYLWLSAKRERLHKCIPTKKPCCQWTFLYV